MEKFNLIKMFSNDYIHRYSEMLAKKMYVYIDKDPIEKVRFQYNIEILLLNVTKLVIILGISFVLRILPQTVLAVTSFNILRHSAFGVHGKNAFSCFVSSASIFIVLVYILNKIQITNVIVLVLFIIFSVLVFLYAPADTEKRPIIGEVKRKRLRNHAIIATQLLMIITLVIPNNNIKTIITWGVFAEVITILPLTYKLLKKRRNNYEYYEKSSKENNC